MNNKGRYCGSSANKKGRWGGSLEGRCGGSLGIIRGAIVAHQRIRRG